jgi:hypothetical protein
MVMTDTAREAMGGCVGFCAFREAVKRAAKRRKRVLL